MNLTSLDTSFCDWLMSLSIKFLRFTHAIAYMSIPFLWRLCNTPLDMPHFLYSFTNGRMGHFYLLVVVNNAAMSMDVQKLPVFSKPSRWFWTSLGLRTTSLNGGELSDLRLSILPGCVPRLGTVDTEVFKGLEPSVSFQDHSGGCP
jgi:hypothetical protein